MIIEKETLDEWKTSLHVDHSIMLNRAGEIISPGPVSGLKFIYQEHHDAVITITPDGSPWPIDIDIVDLVQACWNKNIMTMNSCQGDPVNIRRRYNGMDKAFYHSLAYIQFADNKSYKKWINMTTALRNDKWIISDDVVRFPKEDIPLLLENIAVK